MSDAEPPAKIKVAAAFHAIPQFGQRTVEKILDSCQNMQLTPEEAWQLLDKLVRKGRSVVSQVQLDNWRTFQKRWSVPDYWQYLQAADIQLIQRADFPPLLQQIHHCPLFLYLKGDEKCLEPPHVAIVGTRTPTRYGQWATQKIAADLIGHGVTVVSGFMVGIDYQSHQSAMQLGGRSVGVLGYGLNHVYPAHLRRSAADFLARGNLFLSAYPPDQPPAMGQFPARNTIVAGMSAATVVVEARQKSGSLITAQCALELGRVVGAVPGPIDSVYSQGTHELLRQGAVVVSSGEDIWTEISSLP